MKLIKNQYFQLIAYLIIGLILMYFERIELLYTIIGSVIIVKIFHLYNEFKDKDKFNPWDLNSYN